MKSVAKTGTPMEILDAALRREKAAYEFYAEVRDHARIAIIRDLAEELCEEEQRHIRRVEKMILHFREG